MRINEFEIDPEVELPQKFTEPIICEISNDGKFYTLKKGFIYYRAGEMSDDEMVEYFSKHGKWQNRKEIIVPLNFKSDGFTNFGLDFFVKKYGKGLKCAILHDYLCQKAHAGQILRKEADDIFLESMLQTRAFWKIKAYLLYFAVRFYAKIKGLK